MSSTRVETASGSVYYISEPEHMISGGIFRNDSVCYTYLENLEVGQNLIIRFINRDTIRTSRIEKIVRGTTILTQDQ